MSKLRWSSQSLPRLPRWWQFGGPVPANPSYSVDPQPAAQFDTAPSGWPGSLGEWRIYKKYATPRLPISYDRNKRMILNGLRASFLIGSKLINVSNDKYNPLERASLQGKGFVVLELTERQAQRWPQTKK